MKHCVISLATFLVALLPLQAQPVSDTLITWQEYGRTGLTHVTLYPAPSGDDRRHTFVVREIADNRGPSTLDDARFLVEHIGRAMEIDPAECYWIFHWGAFSFQGGDTDRKELFLRATFRRNPSGALASPAWRVLARAEVEELTDRRFVARR